MNWISNYDSVGKRAGDWLESLTASLRIQQGRLGSYVVKAVIVGVVVGIIAKLAVEIFRKKEAPKEDKVVVEGPISVKESQLAGLTRQERSAAVATIDILNKELRKKPSMTTACIFMYNTDAVKRPAESQAYSLNKAPVEYYYVFFELFLGKMVQNGLLEKAEKRNNDPEFWNLTFKANTIEEMTQNV